MINKIRLLGDKNGEKGKCKHCKKALFLGGSLLLEHRLLTHSTLRTRSTELRPAGEASPPPAESHGHLYLSLPTGTQNNDPRDPTEGAGPTGTPQQGRPGQPLTRECSAPGPGAPGRPEDPNNWESVGNANRGPGPPWDVSLTAKESSSCQPRAEAPRPQNWNSLRSPLKMSWGTGIAVRVSTVL